MAIYAARSIPCLALLALVACGSERKTVDRHVEDLVTIAHGLYGQIITVNDVGNTDEAYQPGFTVDVYALPSGVALGPVLATATSGDRGFWELGLDAGDYVVCTAFQRCVAVTLASGELLRLDYELSVGPGWSAGTPWPP